jgi:TonB-linked SusC/RagA family outer membrane protein
MKRKVMFLLAFLFIGIGLMTAQNRRVTGVVISEEDGQPVVGASVLVKGTTVGTVTDYDGNFVLGGVSADAKTLVVSYIGMQKQEVAIKPSMKIVLKSDAQQIDEVVVTGYGVTKKAAFTGAASTVDSKRIGNKVDPNPIKSLEGTVPGLQMNISSGQPGAPATIFIRGRNSVNSGTQPLYVIDGVAFDNDAVGIRSDEGQTTSPLSTLNAQDIESMTVLKDATATSIYGARAANGVIVITTKRGKVGKPKVNFTAKVGFNEMPSYTDRYKLVNADQNIELASEALLNGYNSSGYDSYFGYYNWAYGLGLEATKQGAEDFYDWFTGGWVSNYRATGQQTDWLKEITRKGLVQSYSFDIAGGGSSENAPQYYVSFAYDNNESIMKGKDMTRYSFRYNMDHQPSKWVKYGFNTNLSYTETNMGAGGGYFSDPLTQVYMMNPMTNVYDEEGNFNFDTTTGYNPVALRSEYGDKSIAKQYRVLLNPYVQINFTPDLYFTSRVGIDGYFIDEFGYWSFLNPQGADMDGMGENSNITRILMTVTNTLNYIKTFKDVHHLNLLIGQEGQSKNYKNAYLAGSGYPVSDLNDVSLAATPGSASTSRSKLKLNSYFFNGQYDLANKYYLSASARADGSSRFASGNRWAGFWSVGAKYRISAEKFMENTKSWLSNATIRASYGTTGNQEVGNDEIANGYYASSSLYGYGYNYNGKPGMMLEQMGNSNLKWETTKKFNVGVDFNLFDRVDVTLDYYNHQTTDMVFAVPISYSTGLSSIYQNIGKLENKGFEASINANIINNKDFRWNITWNGSINKNKVKKLSTDDPIEGSIQITEVGRPIYQWYMKEFAGVDPETGDALWYTTDADGNNVTTTDYNKADKRYLGSANPKFFGSFSTNFDFYGFDLNLQFNYSTGSKIYGSNLRYDAQTGASFYENYIQYVYENRWQQPGDITNVPRLDSEVSYSSTYSSQYLMKGDYLKIRSLTLGYTIPKKLLNKTFLSNARVFMEAENLYTFTAKDYIGMDPAGVGANGVQWWNYPQSRSFIFGVTVGF